MENLEEFSIKTVKTVTVEPTISVENNKPEPMKTKKARIKEKIKEMITDSTIHALPNIYKTEKIYFKFTYDNFSFSKETNFTVQIIIESI